MGPGPGGALAAKSRTIAGPSAGRRAATPPPPPAGPDRTWWFSFLPPAAAAGPPGPLVMFTYRERVSGLRSVHILRASHTDARLRHSQPANSLIGGRGRSLRSPPTQGRRGGGAAASGRRGRRPSSSHRGQLAHPAPSGPRQGVGKSGRRTAFPPLPSFPPPEPRRRGRQFPPGALKGGWDAFSPGALPPPCERAPGRADEGSAHALGARPRLRLQLCVMAEGILLIFLRQGRSLLKPPGPFKVVPLAFLVSPRLSRCLWAPHPDPQRAFTWLGRLTPVGEERQS